jgi:hypothetical protein
VVRVTGLADVVARLAHNASQSTTTLTVDAADLRLVLEELRQSTEVVALDIAATEASATMNATIARYHGQHASARDAWAATHGPVTPATAEITLLRQLADAALDVQDAGRALGLAATTAPTTPTGQLSAAGHRQLDVTTALRIARLQQTQQAHDDALNAYRKRTRP